MDDPARWFAVRTVIRMSQTGPPTTAPLGPGGSDFEERITLWQAADAATAIARAEADAVGYARIVDGEYVGFSQSYELADAAGDGAEVFSLIRRSELSTDGYLDRHFDTGREFQEPT
ncbi:hypothetical protein HJ588_03660 [Flexivirga sp. ID2601S]|uniref:DUF4288 domain-containing protein n=1 Tax=Flexivirga aerilata TaxID=1656889 RepID=A0A849ANJ2_9MICO|nr:hypothetical protein [Flexivirga aerilata]NNG38372.1 hypothetical protein [Flexivirga aerilata]